VILMPRGPYLEGSLPWGAPHPAKMEMPGLAAAAGDKIASATGAAHGEWVEGGIFEREGLRIRIWAIDKERLKRG